MCWNVARAADCVLKGMVDGGLVADFTFINCFFFYTLLRTRKKSLVFVCVVFVQTATVTAIPMFTIFGFVCFVLK